MRPMERASDRKEIMRSKLPTPESAFSGSGVTVPVGKLWD